MEATTLARVKTLLDLSGTTQDAVLSQLIAGTSARMEKFMDRPLHYTARTEEYDLKARQKVVFLRAYPLANQAAITSVKIASNWDFAAATAVDSSDYHVDTDSGALHFNYSPVTRYLNDNMGTAYNAVQVVYSGGFAVEDGGALTTFLAAFPDVAFACETQVVAEWRRRDDPGAQSTKTSSYGKSNFEAPVGGSMRLLPDVVDILTPYRRMRFGQ